MDTVSTHVFQKIELALFLTYRLLNTMSINSITLYTVADVLLGLLTVGDFTLLALPSDQGRPPQEAVECYQGNKMLDSMLGVCLQ